MGSKETINFINKVPAKTEEKADSRIIKDEIKKYLSELPKTFDGIYIDPSNEKNITESDCLRRVYRYAKISIIKIEIGWPRRTDNEDNVNADLRLFPTHTRLSYTSYVAPMYITYKFEDSIKDHCITNRLFSGFCPIMVKSNRCHLSYMTDEELITCAKEDPLEFGGYFIINGREKCLRFVIQQRCNYPIAIKNEKLKTKGVFYTEYAVTFRAMRANGVSMNNILYYTEDHQCIFRILLNRSEWLCPFWVLLKALFPKIQLQSIKQKLYSIANDISFKFEIDNLWTDYIENEAKFSGIDINEDRYLVALGYQFFDGVRNRLPPNATYSDAGRYVINNYILVHTNSWVEKFETLLHMWEKLWLLANEKITPENIDSLAFQELTSAGQIFSAVLQDSIFNILQNVKLSYQIELINLRKLNEKTENILDDNEFYLKTLHRFTNTASKALLYLCSSGNLRTYQLDLIQTTGWTITADRLNMNRFISHFRAVHRGQYFTKMRTTAVRKLVGETWGFICPVHTPDGPSCGLLLHLAQDVIVINEIDERELTTSVKMLLKTNGYQTDENGVITSPAIITNSSKANETVPIVVDGIPIARIALYDFNNISTKLWNAKKHNLYGISNKVEICVFQPNSTSLCGIYLFSKFGRIVRPVIDISTNCIDYLGPLSQPWLSIAISKEDAIYSYIAYQLQMYCLKQLQQLNDEDKRKNLFNYSNILSKITESLIKSKHADKVLQNIINNFNYNKFKTFFQSCHVLYSYYEISKTSFLSINASLTPFSDHNQSPRNMYQCQMLKQTMGTSVYNYPYRSDNKTYRLIAPQKPIVRTQDYIKYGFDNYCSGTNAVIAVISYSGFDMEDAMIINKYALERGEFDACVYRTKYIVAANEKLKISEQKNFIFSNQNMAGLPIVEGLDLDGLPYIGAKMVKGKPFYRVEDTRKTRLDISISHNIEGDVKYYDDDEESFIERIHIVATQSNMNTKFSQEGAATKAIITLRYPRRPTIGDKFASRAGQKGILSLLYKPEDMPFSSNGIIPDIMFNPHGFPSRMTMGMIIELMAGKVGAVTGQFEDSTPFKEYSPNESINSQWIRNNNYNKVNNICEEVDSVSRIQTEEPIDYFGKVLLDNNFEYYGTETLYSGIYGVELDCQIFKGIVYYQRLRHMVSDKWQCRSTGSTDALTRQPLKGRKIGGGIRLGEMERDALLGHGATFVLQDRLMMCSDAHQAFVCPSCGSILSPLHDSSSSRILGGNSPIAICRICDVPCRKLLLPYIFRYLSNELITINIGIKLELNEFEHPIIIDQRGPLHLRAAESSYRNVIE